MRRISTPVDVCVARDVKGLYARQRSGEIQGLTGVDDPYESPQRPELALDTSLLDLPHCVAEVIATVQRGAALPARAVN